MTTLTSASVAPPPREPGPAETAPSEAAPAEPVAVDEGVNAARVFQWAMAGAAGVLVVLLAVGAVWTVRDLLVQVLIAIFIAVSFDPLVRWMIRHRVKRSRAIALVWVATLFVIAGLIWIFVPPLVKQAADLASDFPGYLQHLRETSPGLRSLEARMDLQPRIDAMARDLPGRVAGEALTFGRRFFGAVVSVLLTVVLTIYLMLDLPRLRRGLVRVFPKRHRPQVSETVNLVIDKVGAYMVGNLLISLIAGVTALVAFLALRVPFALPLALFVAVADLIPFVGASLAAVVSVVVAAATVDLWPNTVLLALFFLAYQQLENYVIAPRVMRGTVDISALAVLFAALVGGSILGLVGALMAIPVAAALKVIISDRIRARDEAVEEEQASLETAAAP